MTNRVSNAGTGVTATDLLSRILDAAVRIPSKNVHKRVERYRRRNPDAAPSEILSMLEKEYRWRVSSVGGGVGVAAAVPAMGSLTAFGLAGVQLAQFVSESAMHVMAVAHLYGVPIDDLERRRTLLLATMLGEDGAAAVQQELGMTTMFWARALFVKLPITGVRALNRRLLSMAGTSSARLAGHALGRLVPFGIGAVIGFTASRKMALEVIEGSRLAFGPPPLDSRAFA